MELSTKRPLCTSSACEFVQVSTSRRQNEQLSLCTYRTNGYIRIVSDASAQRPHDPDLCHFNHAQSLQTDIDGYCSGRCRLDLTPPATLVTSARNTLLHKLHHLE